MGYQQSQRASAVFPHLLILCLGVTCSPVTLGVQPFPDPKPGGLSLVLKAPNFLTPQKNLFVLILSESWMLHVAVWEGSSVSSFPSPLPSIRRRCSCSLRQKTWLPGLQPDSSLHPGGARQATTEVIQSNLHLPLRLQLPPVSLLSVHGITVLLVHWEKCQSS